MPDEAPLTHGLVRLLRWRDDAEGFAERLSSLHLDTLANRLGRGLARLRLLNPGDGAAIEAALDALPNHALQRLLTAPRTCLRLAGSTEADTRGLGAYLREVITVEAGRGEGWDCLGAFHRVPGQGEGAGSALPPAGTAVDYASPFALGPLPEVPGLSTGFTVQELETVFGRLGLAVAGMRQVPAAARHFQRFVRSVMLRKDPTASSLRSASSSLTVGLVVFRNPHLDGVNREDLAEGLIHEMIHSLCDIIEFSEPFIIDRAAVDQRIASPWSGRSLDLNTYIQACYVWYGLWEFWLAAFDTGLFDARNAVSYFQASSRGLRRGIVGPLEPVARCLSPGLLDGLAMMEARAREALQQLAV